MLFAIAHTLATVSIVAYLAAMALEVWRPGFVTYFWNPQFLLITAIIGIILTCFGNESKTSRVKSVAFFIIFVILMAWFSVPAGLTRIAVTFSTLFLIIGTIYLLRIK